MTNGLFAISEWWQDGANIAQVVGFPLAGAALAFAWWQLRKAAKAARGQFLLAIDEALAKPDHEELRAKIYRTEHPWTVDDDPGERNKVRRYIAVFERLGILLRDRSVSIRHVNQLYGDRIAAITNNESARKLVLASPEAWRDFIYLWKRIERRRKGTRLKPHSLRDGKREAKEAIEVEDRFEIVEAQEPAAASAAQKVTLPP